MNRAPLVVATLLLILPILYLTSYLALVVPEGCFVEWRGQTTYGGQYRVGGKSVSPYVYWPLEQVDRKLRRNTWEPDQRPPIARW